MDETFLDDALLMREATTGDAELLAVDLWLHDAFVQFRGQDDTLPVSTKGGELPQ